MKKLALFFVFVAGCSFSAFSQSYCDCESFLGDECRVQCPGETMADCETTWYGGCNCSCTEKLKPAPDETASLNLNNIKLLRDYLKKDTELKLLTTLISELKPCLTDNQIVLISKEEHQHSFQILNKLFLSLSAKDQAALYWRTI